MNQARVKAIALVAMCFALFMSYLDDTVVNLALPKIQSSLGAGVSGLQWILNAYTLPAASLVLTSGTLGDIYGRKRVFLTGLVIFTTASVVCGLAPNLSILIAGRTLQGIGAAALVPSSLAILAHTFPGPKEKMKAIAIWSAISGLALVAGPMLGGLLVDIFGWQSIFFLNVPLGAIAFWITSSVVKEVRNPSKQNIDLPGLVLSIIFLASLTYALTESHPGGWQSPLTVWLLLAAGVSFLTFLIIESHSSHPMLPLKLFQNSTFVVASVVQILIFFSIISLLFIFSLFLQQVQGYSAAATGLRFLPMNVAFVTASLVSGWFATRLGWRFTVIAGLILASFATFLLSGVNVNTEYRAVLWNIVLCGFGSGLTIAPLTAAALSSAPTALVGIVSAVLNTSSRLGSVLGIALQGTIFTERLTSQMKRSLMSWNLPANLQDKLTTHILQSGTQVPSDLPASITPSIFQQAISNAFVSGLHAVVLVASLALLAGALLILVVIALNAKQASRSPNSF